MVAGIGAFAMLDSRTRMKPVLWLVMFTAIFGQLVYPIYYGSMIDGTWQGTLFQITSHRPARDCDHMGDRLCAAPETLRRPPATTSTPDIVVSVVDTPSAVTEPRATADESALPIQQRTDQQPRDQVS